MKSATCAALLTLGLGWFRPLPAHAELAPLRTAATLSGRPIACTPRTSARAKVWQDARAASGSAGGQLCARMAEISRLLTTDPAKAARLVEQTLGAGAERPLAAAGLEDSFRLLQARVALANGRTRLAFELFHRVAMGLPISEWDPPALRDYGVSAATEGRYSEAAVVYRRLVAVSSWLDVPTRNAVRIEATMAVLRLQDPDTVEALGYLSGLEGQESDASIATLGVALHALISRLASQAPLEAHPITGSISELRQLARLSEHDVRLLATWIEWTQGRNHESWSWTRDERVPAVYRALAAKLESGG